MKKKIVEKGFSKEFFIVLVLIILTFFFFIYEMNQMGTNQIYIDSKEIIVSNRILKEKIEIVKTEIDLLKTDQGIEMIARKKLRLVKPGEIIIMEYNKKNTGESSIIEKK
jgi:cell division protein FtsB